MDLPQDVYERLADNHNSLRGHVGLKFFKRRLKAIRKHRVKDNLKPDDMISDRMINEFLR
jgi:regulator of PEP synthase PpsR (kinase-PPPase family)